MATYAQIQSVLDYFGSDSSIYRKIVLGQATDAEISYAFTQIPRMKADLSASGTVLGYSYDEPVYLVPDQTDDIVNALNSNVGGGGYSGGVSANYPISFGRDASGNAYINAGKNAAGATIKAVADRVSLGITGVNIGAKLGKAIDSAIYNLDPAWWDAHYPTINPDTWTSIAGENELGQNFIRTLFNIDDNGNVTGYVDEKILAQTYQMLRDNGLYDISESTYNYDDIKTLTYLDYPNFDYTIYTNNNLTFTSPSGRFFYEIISPAPMYVYRITNDSYASRCVSLSDFTITIKRYDAITGTIDTSQKTATRGRLKNGTTYYNVDVGLGFNPFTQGVNITPISIYNRTTEIINQTPYERDIATIILLGDAIATGGGIDGITDIEGATQYPPTNITGTTLDDVLTQLKQEYPQLFDNSITESVLQPDGTIQTKTYVPVPWQVADPNTGDATSDKTITNPITQINPSQQTTISPEIAPQIITQTNTAPTLDDLPTDPPSDTPDTGTGDTPPSVIPVGSASSLWAIYNPTQAELNSFGGWLWSSDFVEQLKKLFNDPMQAIIGVHKVFATPITGASQTIVCGYLDSGVSSKIVTSQYSEVDCGSVDLMEYFGNVFDYSPFTSVKLFLPFIGIVPLDVGFVMRSKISIKYTVDVLTGACLANVHVIRDGVGGVIFSYAGSAIVSYPISSGSYMGVVSGALSIAAGIVGTVASGGAAIPAVAGAVSGISRAHTDVQHSGQFSGAAGAMGIKKPYLIVSRPQTRVADNIAAYAGIPSNATMRLGECVGFTKVLEAHLSIPNAYDNEIAEILLLLKEGVII